MQAIQHRNVVDSCEHDSKPRSTISPENTQNSQFILLCAKGAALWQLVTDCLFYETLDRRHQNVGVKISVVKAIT